MTTHTLMSGRHLQELVKNIVQDAAILKNKYTDQKDARVNYACIFTHSLEEYESLKRLALELGSIIEETPTGPLYQIEALETPGGVLKLLKVRMPDKNNPESGDADFTVSDYPSFKSKYLPLKQFKLIKRPLFEMIELMDPSHDVRVYFSYPPLDQQLHLK